MGVSSFPPKGFVQQEFLASTPKELTVTANWGRIDRFVRQLVQIVAHNTERIASRGAAPFEPTAPQGAKVTAGEREVAIEHHFTVDVEEYFQVSAFERHVSRADWERLESRVSRAVDTLLGLLERFKTRATFFVPSPLTAKACSGFRSLPSTSVYAAVRTIQSGCS